MSLNASDLLVFDLVGNTEQQLTLIKHVKEHFPVTRKIYFTQPESVEVSNLIEEHGGLCIHKDMQYPHILEMIYDFDTNSSPQNAGITKLNEFQSPVHFPGAEKPLTKNQARAMECLCAGMSAKETALSMNLSYDTARAHIKGAYIRLMAKNQAQAVSHYREALAFSTRMHDNTTVEN